MGLTLTGLPLKFSRHPWVAALMMLFGEPDRAGFFHRIFAILLAGVALFHAVSVCIMRTDRKKPLRDRISGPDSLLPGTRDARQFMGTLRWFSGRGPRPDLNRWSYREKFDYWATLITVGALAASGIVLWFPTVFARFLSGHWFNLAMVIHGYAGLMTLGFILMIHLFNTSLRREGFPVNDVIFTGQLSEGEFQVERSAQYARLAETDALNQLRVGPASIRKRKISFYAAVASQVLGIVLFILIVCATAF
jgi:hypothetical protein